MAGAERVKCMRAGAEVRDQTVKVTGFQWGGAQAAKVKNCKKVVLFCLSEDRKMVWEEGQGILVGDVGQADDDALPALRGCHRRRTAAMPSMTMICASSKDPIKKKRKGIKHEYKHTGSRKSRTAVPWQRSSEVGGTGTVLLLPGGQPL
ncbi:cofilin-1-like [Kogia breviceps]|uniref:cofilin-1-like n=1 Tax=Kogia breviceps TaxID=27615 RepID=UPI0034D1C4E1